MDAKDIATRLAAVVDAVDELIVQEERADDIAASAVEEARQSIADLAEEHQRVVAGLEAEIARARGEHSLTLRLGREVRRLTGETVSIADERGRLCSAHIAVSAERDRLRRLVDDAEEERRSLYAQQTADAKRIKDLVSEGSEAKRRLAVAEAEFARMATDDANAVNAALADRDKALADLTESQRALDAASRHVAEPSVVDSLVSAVFFRTLFRNAGRA